MATWIKFSTDDGAIILADLDKSASFTHILEPDDYYKCKQVKINIHGQQVWITENAAPDAYKRVLAYMEQIERQIE